MNRQQLRRKHRERKKTYDGIVSSLAFSEPLARESIHEMMRLADQMRLHGITQVCNMALERDRAIQDAKRAEFVAEQCQKEMSDMQVKIAKMEQALEGGNVARVRRMSKKARAHRPEKKGYRSAKWHPMSGYKNPRNRHAR